MRIEWVLPQPPFSRKNALIVGVSGGADSLGLLFLLLEQLPQASRRLVVAHVNYGLRGKEAERDEKAVREICRQERVRFQALRVRRFAQRARQLRHSPQNFAREIRYSFFQKLAFRYRAWGVAVAHHQEDQAETLLDRLLRGAGPRGFSGLRPVQKLVLDGMNGSLRVWRPLLQFKKKELQSFLKSRGVVWREDHSNRTSRYRRNQIRNKVLPFLKKWNPNLPETLSRIGEVTAAEDHFFEGLLAPLERKLGSLWAKGQYSCAPDEFEKTPLALQRRWVRHVAEKLTSQARGISFERIEEAIRLWKGKKKGPRDLGYGLSAGLSLKGKAYMCHKIPGSKLPKRK